MGFQSVLFEAPPPPQQQQSFGRSDDLESPETENLQNRHTCCRGVGGRGVAKRKLCQQCYKNVRIKWVCQIISVICCRWLNCLVTTTREQLERPGLVLFIIFLFMIIIRKPQKSCTGYITRLQPHFEEYNRERLGKKPSLSLIVCVSPHPPDTHTHTLTHSSTPQKIWAKTKQTSIHVSPFTLRLPLSAYKSPWL